MAQRLPSPSKNFYLGTGKLEELVALKSKYDYDVVVTDDELSPQQQQNLEERLNVRVIDRVALILDIFAHRAQTREGRLQVELAQHEYLLPRLAGKWRHLERLGGGIGTRGPGESQLETDRRLIRRRIYRLQSQLEQVRKQRHLYQARRRKSDIPVAAIVGYTNAGKSTLFNALTEAGVLVENKLFATLDPTTRRVALPDGRIILLTDTVGFIRKLPPTIISAFRATLEELSQASVLLHVVDVASRSAVEQSGVVEDTLRQLELLDKPRITVLNKMDLLLPDEKTWDESTAMEFLSDREKFSPAAENTVLVSAGKKWGLTALLTVIGQVLTLPGVLMPDFPPDITGTVI
jgi:GTP-binding protein HflX